MDDTTSAVTLISLGAIADWIDQSVTAMLTGTITPIIASATAKILPFVTVGVMINLMWYGWLIMTGSIQQPALEALRKIVHVVLVVTIASTGGLYQTEIATAMMDLPTEVVQLFTDSVRTPTEIMDNAANNGAEIGTRLQERAPSGIRKLGATIGFFVVAFVITIISAVMSALGMMVLITMKVGMGLVVVLGPFCILALLFEKTQKFFQQWLGQAIYYSIYAGLFMLVFVFIMGMFGMLQKGLLDLTTANEINIFSMLSAIVFFMICSKFILDQVSSVAHAVTGGQGGGFSIPFIGKFG